jgi:hypothetical protein
MAVDSHNEHPSGTCDLVLRSLKPGIYVPIPSFFLSESEDLGIFKFLTPMNAHNKHS